MQSQTEPNRIGGSFHLMTPQEPADRPRLTMGLDARRQWTLLQDRQREALRQKHRQVRWQLLADACAALEAAA